MDYISIIDAHGKHWVLNKAYIVGMAPTMGADDWAQGAQLFVDQSALGVAFISIRGGDVPTIRLALGAVM